MHNLTDVDAFGTMQCIQDGDNVSNALLEPSAQEAANRTLFLKNRVYGTAIEEMRIPMTALSADSRWTWAGGGLISIGWVQTDVTTAGSLWIELTLPKQGKLTGVTIGLRGAVGHAGLPATMPTVYLIRQNGQDGSAAKTVLSTVADSAASVSAYETAHFIQITGLTEAFDASTYNRYYLQITGETSTNAIVNLIVTEVLAVLAAA